MGDQVAHGRGERLGGQRRVGEIGVAGGSGRSGGPDVARGDRDVVGLLRVFYFEKGAAYYFSNHAFLTKLSVFVLLVLLSAVPTVWFLSWRRPLKAGQLPAIDGKKQRMVRGLIHAELTGIVIILLCAALMAKGGLV